MCALRKELAIDFNELHVFEITCQCGTVIVFDVLNLKVPIPTNCPGCGEAFGDPFRQGVRDFRDAHRLLTQESPHPTVAVKLPWNGGLTDRSQ